MNNFIFTFFDSISSYISFNQILFITLGLFLFTMFVVIITTSRSYEAKLIKSINRFNNYFSNNPQLTEDNLLQFNKMMKSSRVPRLICKQWQQFVLYREGKASSYLSYEICVNNPLKNSSYKRDVKVMNLVSYLIAFLSFIVNVFCAYELDVVTMFQFIFLGPVIVLILNWLVSVILTIKYNAIVNDVNQTFAFFQVNIDKATQTIPEYVDYEVLFEKSEIKRGIPILYAYLQKRAEDEKRELERARLKNVEHEKFNFDEAGVESSLVLERAMQEAENYIAERKKYMEDTSQVNNEINQEDLNYREITKEYQRQMQVSKESFNNFKDQLSEASSTIEANYLKKQQQQELDRQRNLERDYDAATERHKKAIESLQQELSELEKSINASRSALEKAMMSEFATYGSKVYDAAHKLATYREQEKVTDLKKEIKQLEEKIVLLNQNKPTDADDGSATVDQNLIWPTVEDEQIESAKQEEEVTKQPTEPIVDKPAEPVVQPVGEAQKVEPLEEDDSDDWDFEFDDDEDNTEPQQEQVENDAPNALEAGITFNYLDEAPTSNSTYTPAQEQPVEQPVEEVEQSAEQVNEQPVEEVEQSAEQAIEQTTEEVKQEPTEVKPRKKAGRPRKEVSPDELNKPKRPRGRPKKEVDEAELEKPKRPRGRPKKQEVVSEPANTVAKRGRPKKEEAVSELTTEQAAPAKKRGRPRKVIIIEEETPAEAPKKRGRPRKIVVREIPKDSTILPPSITDIDEYLKAIDNQIAEENLKIEQSQKELEKNSTIRRRKK